MPTIQSQFFLNQLYNRVFIQASSNVAYSNIEQACFSDEQFCIKTPLPKVNLTKIGTSGLTFREPFKELCVPSSAETAVVIRAYGPVT